MIGSRPGEFLFRTLAIVGLLAIVPAFALHAQTTYQSIASWSTTVSQTSAPFADSRPANCHGTTIISTSASPAHISSGCVISGTVSGKYTPCGGCTPLSAAFDAGNVESTNWATADPGVGVSAHASVGGLSASGTTLSTTSFANFFERVVVSGPSDITSAVLTTTYSGAQRGSLTGTADVFAFALTQSGDIGPELCDASISACAEAFGTLTGGAPEPLTLSVPWGLVANDMFAYNVEVYVIGGGNGLQDGDASIFASTPTLALFDAAGNDVTNEHTITFDPGGTIDAQPPVTSTPEPASMTLVATGLAGIGGAGFRRRKRSRESW